MQGAVPPRLCWPHVQFLHRRGKYWCDGVFRHPTTRCILSLFPSCALVASWCLGSSVDLGRQIRQEENWSEGGRQVEEVVDQLASGGRW